MSSPLQQLQLSYDQLQDRLVLSLHTKDFCEYRFWITRHVTSAFWKILLELLKADQKGQLEHARESKKASEQIQQEKMQRQATADKFAQRVMRRPLGEEPLLLAKIQAKIAENGVAFLHLEDVQGRSIEFTGNSTIVVALCQLIQETIKKANWNLILDTPP